MIAKLICRFLGHRRGKRISPTHVKCPRCGRESPREKREKKAAA